MSKCCGDLSRLLLSANDLVKYRDILDSWMNGEIGDEVLIANVPVPTLLTLISDMQELIQQYIWGIAIDTPFPVNDPEAQAALAAQMPPGAFVTAPVNEEEDEDGNDIPIATLTSPGAVQPDGITTTVDATGLLSALGENLQLNSEVWITESGVFIAPVTGWYNILTIDGGCGGWANSTTLHGRGGESGAYKHFYAYFSAGDSIQVTIGSAGQGLISDYSNPSIAGGKTSFGELEASLQGTCFIGVDIELPTSNGDIYACGAGFGGGRPLRDTEQSAGRFYGAGGGCCIIGTNKWCGDGAPGAARIRYYDPTKANSPAAASTLALPRKATRAIKSATVNLYDPATGQGSVWRKEDAPAQLAKGLISQEAWQAICEQQAAEAHAAWLADPDTGAERFRMLRSARDARLAATDYLVAPDYPIDADALAEVKAYRQALRDLPAQDGAPWDGGGELTPWPEMPILSEEEGE